MCKLALHQQVIKERISRGLSCARGASLAHRRRRHAPHGRCGAALIMAACARAPSYTVATPLDNPAASVLRRGHRQRRLLGQRTFRVVLDGANARVNKCAAVPRLLQCSSPDENMASKSAPSPLAHAARNVDFGRRDAIACCWRW